MALVQRSPGGDRLDLGVLIELCQPLQAAPCTPFAASNNGGFCCETTPDGARAAYPGKNLVELPGQTQLAPDQIPPLRHVDGYIIQNAIDHTKLEYRGAVDGAMDGIAECCTADVATMRREHPTENLAYLPSFGQ